MQCPKCQAEVPEWQFYCSNCRAQVQTYEPEVGRPLRGRIERAGLRVLNALVWVSIIIALILVGRMVAWSELIAAIRGDAAVSEKVETDSKVKRASRSHSEKGRVDTKTPIATKVVEASGGEKNDPVASRSATPQKVEKLPPTQDQPQSQNRVEQVGAKNGDEAGLVINSHTPAKIY